MKSRYHVYGSITRDALRGLFKHTKRRDDGVSHKEYEGVWKSSDHRLQKFLYKPRPALYHGTPAVIRGLDLQKQAVYEMSDAISSFRPASVLELGAGNGANLLALAALHPEITTWTGIDITESGPDAANKLQKDPPMEELAYLTGLDPAEISQRLARVVIECLVGDMRALPFADGSFDFVFSHVAFEQLPRDHLTAFREARRVCRKHACFIEEFREAQGSLFRRLHLRNVDYFRASYDVCVSAGFTLLRFTPMPLQNLKLGTGMAVCGVTRGV